MDKIRQNFGLNLKKLRRSKKLTQEQLAEQIGLNQRQLTRIETGRSFPSFATLDALSQALNVEPVALFDFDNSFEVLCNGTDGTIRYNGKTQDNVIYLIPCNENENNDVPLPIGDEENMVQMAKNLNHVIKVDYYDKDELLQTILYYPDGKKELKDAKNNTTISDVIWNIKNGINRHENSIQKLKFIELAIESLDNRVAAEKLQLILDGMLM